MSIQLKILRYMFEIKSKSLSCSFVKYPSMQPESNVQVILDNLIQKGLYPIENVIENEPLLFSLFGAKDMLILREIESIDIINKLLVNHCPNGNSLIKCSDPFYGILQNISGYTYCSEEEVLKNLEDKLFVGVTQFKLNNAYLLSGGIHFLKNVIATIDNQLKFFNKNNNSDILSRYIISFSAYELCLLTFGDDVQTMNDFILTIRENSFDKLVDKNGSRKFYEYLGDEHSDNYNIFSDSQTIFGVKMKITDSKNFVLDDKFINKNLNIDLVWKIKPGYLTRFIEYIKEYLPEFNARNYRIISGKTDLNFKNYFTCEEYYKLFINYYNDEKFRSIIRSINAGFVFDNPNISSEINSNINVSDSHIKHLSYSLQKIVTIDKKLKEILELSDTLRYRIMKMFHLYNVGISSSITFTLYYDLCPFLIEVESEIDKLLYSTSTKIEKHNIQHFFEELVSNYEKAYYVRMIHNLHHEDGSEILINFNTSLPGYISSIDSIVKLTSSFIEMSITDNRFKHNCVVSILDNIRSISSKHFANFDLTSSLTPGLFFSYLSKEVFVLLFKDSSIRTYANSITYILQDEWQKSIQNSGANFNIELLNISQYSETTLDYFIIDYLRFVYFYNSDFNLYNFWFKATLLQVSTHYEINGLLNEKQWFLEIMRLAFIFKLSENENNKEEFLKLNPFDEDLYKLNHLIWKKLADSSFNIVNSFINIFSSNNQEYLKRLFDVSLSVYKINKLSYDTLKNKIFNLGRSSEEIDLNTLGVLIIQLINCYFVEVGEMFKYNVILLHDSGCTDLQLLKKKKEKDIEKEKEKINLFASATGGFWLHKNDIQKYNKINFEYMELISHIAYMYKLTSFGDFYNNTNKGDHLDSKD